MDHRTRDKAFSLPFEELSSSRVGCSIGGLAIILLLMLLLLIIIVIIIITNPGRIISVLIPEMRVEFSLFVVEKVGAPFTLVPDHVGQLPLQVEHDSGGWGRSQPT
jgi:hypothetical protein